MSVIGHYVPQVWDLPDIDAEVELESLRDEDPQTIISYAPEEPNPKKIYQVNITPETIDRIDLLVSGGDKDDPMFSFKLVPLEAIITIIPDMMTYKEDKDGDVFNGFFSVDHKKIVIHKFEIPRLERAIADGYTHFPMIVYFSSRELSMLDVLY
jgi:hypothetical protein